MQYHIWPYHVQFLGSSSLHSIIWLEISGSKQTFMTDENWFKILNIVFLLLTHIMLYNAIDRRIKYNNRIVGTAKNFLKCWTTNTQTYKSFYSILTSNNTKSCNRMVMVIIFRLYAVCQIETLTLKQLFFFPVTKIAYSVM